MRIYRKKAKQEEIKQLKSFSYYELKKPTLLGNAVLDSISSLSSLKKSPVLEICHNLGNNVHVFLSVLNI